MKDKVIILIFLLIVYSILFCEEIKEDKNNIKKIVSKTTEEISVEVKKPDNASLMTRRKTEFRNKRISKMKSKIKKSNILLY